MIILYERESQPVELHQTDVIRIEDSKPTLLRNVRVGYAYSITNLRADAVGKRVSREEFIGLLKQYNLGGIQ